MKIHELLLSNFVSALILNMIELTSSSNSKNRNNNNLYFKHFLHWRQASFNMYYHPMIISWSWERKPFFDLIKINVSTGTSWYWRDKQTNLSLETFYYRSKSLWRQYLFLTSKRNTNVIKLFIAFKALFKLNERKLYFSCFT